MVSEKQIEVAADQISEGLGAFLRKFCDSEASKLARYYLHEMPKDEWNQMVLMLATEALTAAERTEPAPAARTVTEEMVEVLNRIRDTAMEHTLTARIPECGVFSGIAQDADWLLSELTAAKETDVERA